MSISPFFQLTAGVPEPETVNPMPTVCDQCGADLHISTVIWQTVALVCLQDGIRFERKESKEKNMDNSYNETLASMAADQADLVEREGEICPECDNTPETGACFYCRMD